MCQGMLKTFGFGAPFHHDSSYFDFDGSMCVLWLPLTSVKKQDGIAWIKGSHLWNKLFLRTRFKEPALKKVLKKMGKLEK